MVHVFHVFMVQIHIYYDRSVVTLLRPISAHARSNIHRQPSQFATEEKWFDCGNVSSKIYKRAYYSLKLFF